MKLVLCANTRQLEGFKHHDILPLAGIDYVCDLFSIGDFVKAESCDEIHFTHALEHFPTKQTPFVLDLIRGLLKQGGRLYIEVPNFAWHASLINDGRERDAVKYAFGGQLDEYDFHKTGFTPTILKEELEDAGFINVDIKDGSSLEAHCTK